MLSTLNDIKKGLNIIHNDEPCVVIEANFVRMQQRKPVMQTKMRNLVNGKVLEINFHPNDKIEEADMQRKKVDYLYSGNDGYFFMDPDSYEQFTLSAEFIGDNSGYMKAGDKVDALYFNGQPIAISMPPKVDLKVVSAPAGVRGNSAQGRVTKTAETETGLKVQVPLFIKEGDIIRISTTDGSYSERV